MLSAVFTLFPCHHLVKISLSKIQESFTVLSPFPYEDTDAQKRLFVYVIQNDMIICYVVSGRIKSVSL